MGVLSPGWITGLAAEARLLPRHVPVAIGGGTPAGARAAAEQLIAQGVTALISFGLAGGLDPSLHPGTIIIPAAIRDGDDTFPTDPNLTRQLGGPTHPTLFCGTGIAATAAEKAAHFARTQAPAIDLESGPVARAAAAHHLPCAALRAICDPATTTLPPAALIALNSQGQITLLKILASLTQTPTQLPALLKLAKEAKTAREALIRTIREKMFVSRATAKSPHREKEPK